MTIAYRKRGGWLALLLLAGPLSAADERVDGNFGLLHVRGALTESACHLAMDSAWQEVDMGTTATGALKKPGDQGTPVRVEIRLEDCLPSPTSVRDAWSGDLLWSRDQPSVTVSFVAPGELSNPGLVRVTGASGLALRLTDRLHRSVRLNGEGHPLLLEPGDNTLFYYIAPERTPAPLVAGAWQALIHFRLNYD
ncbi:TPA: type 1 fimbrial protein [Klebsiella quasipneumoniae subsp. similipneumoniae]|nr:type 1 fimbrial protein [Klebsiella quasipneumoniae subsp. similipneumoniae]